MLSFKILTKRERIIAFFALGIIAISAILNFILLPLINRYQALNREISLCQLNLKKSSRLLSKRERIQQDYNEISSLVQLEAGEDRIIALVLTQLENLANQADLRIVDVRPQAPRNLERYKEIIVELKQEGRIEGFLRFIYDLENPPHLFRIKKLQLNPKAVAGILDGYLTVSKIYLPGQQP